MHFFTVVLTCMTIFEKKLMFNNKKSLKKTVVTPCLIQREDPKSFVQLNCNKKGWRQLH